MCRCNSTSKLERKSKMRDWLLRLMLLFGNCLYYYPPCHIFS